MGVGNDSVVQAETIRTMHVVISTLCCPLAKMHQSLDNGELIEWIDTIRAINPVGGHDITLGCVNCDILGIWQ